MPTVEKRSTFCARKGARVFQWDGRVPQRFSAYTASTDGNWNVIELRKAICGKSVGSASFQRGSDVRMGWHDVMIIKVKDRLYGIPGRELRYAREVWRRK